MGVYSLNLSPQVRSDWLLCWWPKPWEHQKWSWLVMQSFQTAKLILTSRHILNAYPSSIVQICLHSAWRWPKSWVQTFSCRWRGKTERSSWLRAWGTHWVSSLTLPSSALVLRAALKRQSTWVRRDTLKRAIDRVVFDTAVAFWSRPRPGRSSWRGGGSRGSRLWDGQYSSDERRC